MKRKIQELKKRLSENQIFIDSIEQAKEDSRVFDDEIYNKYVKAIEEQKEIALELKSLSGDIPLFYTFTQMQRKEPEIEVDECKIEDVVELSNAEYHYFRCRLLNNYDFIAENVDKMYNDDEGVCHCLLVLGEGENDGILVESEGSHYARYSAFLPNAREFIQKNIQTMADELIFEATYNTENGLWVVGFDEMSQRFDSTVTFQNGIGQKLIEELERRKEVSQIIATEDSIEMTCHLEHTPVTHNSEDGLMNLFSLMGCNLSEIHLVHDEEEHDLATIEELNQNTLTEEGKAEWSDVLNAKVVGIYSGYYGTQISLKDVKPERLEAFSKMLAGYCTISETNRWVNPANTDETFELKMN